jgi:four helix bundle protein
MGAERIYDLEKRTENFSLRVKKFCKAFKSDYIDRVYVLQLVRSSSSVAANYIEANEKLGEKDLQMRIRICKKEIKESRLWLNHLSPNDTILETERIALLNETIELQNIFGAIIKKLTAAPN